MYDVQDDRGVPVSAGVPPIVRISALVGLIVIFAIVGMVVAVSSYGHAWPANTSNKIPL